MNEKSVLIITSLATFSLTLISIFSFRKAKDNIAFLWLGLLFLSPAFSFVSNLLIYLKEGNTLLFHISMFLNLSWGGYLVLIFNNLRSKQNRYFNLWLFVPSVAYLPFMFYSFAYPQYVNEIVTGQYQSVSFIVSSFYNLLIVGYSIFANLLMMIREVKQRHLTPQHKVRAEILTVMLILQILAFVPFALKLDIVYVILYMPVFGQIFFLYVFFRLTPGKADSLLNPEVKKKYMGLNVSAERKNEVERKITELMKVKKPFLREDCTLQLIANELNESPNMISMVINSHFSKSLPDFINHYRIKMAIEILQSGNKNLTIEGVAYECGFGNRISFYKAFKKETGKTPSEYLKAKEFSKDDKHCLEAH